MATKNLANNHSSRRAQFATEFLMTYGWAIAVIAVIFTLLYALGIIDVQGLVPEKCVLTPGFACRDYLLEPDSITLQLTNGIGKTVVINTMQAQHKAFGSCPPRAPAGILAIPNGVTQQFVLACPLSLPRGSKERVMLNFSYTIEDDSDLFYARGEIFSRVS